MVCADTECRYFSGGVPALSEQDGPATLARGLGPFCAATLGPLCGVEMCAFLCRNVLGCTLGTFVGLVPASRSCM